MTNDESVLRLGSVIEQSSGWVTGVIGGDFRGLS